MPATTGMKSAGFYDQYSGTQMSSIDALRDWIDEAVTGLRLPDPPHAVTILDLGSSEGRNAINLMAGIVAGLRRSTAQPIQTIYSDLATNNFNQLFANLEAARRTGHFPVDVFSAAVGGSFYERLMPSGTVHFATSFNAIVWLDKLPDVPVLDFVVFRRPHPARPRGAASPEAGAAFRRQAEGDLTRFLECRALELVPGGKLLVATPGDTDEVCVVDGLFDVLNDACLDLISSGDLKREEYERFTMPGYYRTVEELLAPLQLKDSPVRGAFTVDRAGAIEVPPPYIVEFQRNGDALAYAAAYTGFLRAISEPVVCAAFNKGCGKAETVDSLYDRVRARLLAEPERYFWRYIVVAALLTRR
jgi:cyclopropane-fatty-acyl-phospholipid synthase